MPNRLILILLGCAVTATCYAADMKFFRKAAEKVWQSHPELFDASRPVPDSVAAGHSAVILCSHCFLDARYERVTNARMDRTFTRRTSFCHRMVKLLDQKGVADFAQHEFGESMRAKVLYHTFMKEDNAFGARIHKPDGSVREVDLSEAFAITEGKKGDDKNALKRKIDIPGLEPGDVFEYFTYDEDMVQEYDPTPVKIELLDSYPILETLIECRFSPKLTVEYRNYNDAPALAVSEASNGDRLLTLQRYNLPVLTDKRFLAKERQLPFYVLYTLNNTSPVRYYPASARRGTLNGNIMVGTVYRDISHTLADADYSTSDTPGRLRKLIRDFRRDHPEASRTELLDAAWTGAVYLNNKDADDEVSDYWLAVMFSDIAEKEALADTIGVGFLNSVHDVPTYEIVNWRQPDYGVYADGRFLMENSTLSLPAGELKAAYQGERGGAYTGPRESLSRFHLPHVFTAPKTPAHKNRSVVQCTVTPDAEGGARAAYAVALTGSAKEKVLDFTSSEEWYAEVEEYLGIAAAKRMKLKNYDAVERAKEVKKLAGDYVNGYLYAGDDAEADSVVVHTRGVVPSAPVFNMSLEAEMTDAVMPAGDDLIVYAGRFAGNNPRIPDAERGRQTDVYLASADQNYYDITIRIPEGYEADAESLAALKCNVRNPVGMFFADASVGEDGAVVVHVREKNNYSFIPISAWDAVLELSDARAAFNDVAVVLKRKP